MISVFIPANQGSKSLEVNLNSNEPLHLKWDDADAADQSALEQPSLLNFYSSSKYTSFLQ